MINSMTGFGRCSVDLADKSISVEIKSVNCRGIECSVRLPRAFSSLEENIRAYILDSGISRGKIDVYVDISQNASDDVRIVLDEAYAESYINALYALRDKFGLTDDISVMNVAKNNELFKTEKVKRDAEKDVSDLLSALAPAVTDFLQSRQREGANLAADFKRKLDSIEQMLGQVEAISKEDTSSYRTKLEEKLRTALADNKITADENRILTECAIFADKIAIDEETVRLRSHLDTFRQYMNSHEAVGRKLNFLHQEIVREVNTIGSKCSNSSIARLVVNMKSEAEKLREQVQNVE